MKLIGRRRPCRFAGHVKELSERDVSPHAGILRAGGACRGGGERREGLFEEVIAPAEQEIAQEDRAVAAEILCGSGPAEVVVGCLERAPRRRGAAASVGVVEDVVMYERGGLEDLEGRSERNHALAGRLCSGRSPAPIRESGAQALAPREGSGGVIEQHV